MILPPIQGNICQAGFFIFAACDTVYFDEFAKSLINSVLKNTKAGIHLHIFNPRDDQLEFCQKDPRISISYEYVPISLFNNAANHWNREPLDSLEKLRYTRTITAMTKGRDKSLIERIQKTYFACARFISLSKLTEPTHSFFAMDIDAIVRNDIPKLPSDKSCYLHKITGKKARVLAGGIYIDKNIQGYQFLKEYAESIIYNLERDYIYWSLDQDILDYVVPKYNVGDLPISLIDWEMRQSSIIWTAKGTRKDLPIFISEQKKYIS
jgi:hypothetical protein